MITRLMMAAVLLAATACTTPVADAPAEVAAPWACRDVVRGAAVQAYALARFRDDQRAVILLPAGKGAAEYEAETNRLRDEGARLLGMLKANDPGSETLPPAAPASPSAMTDEKVAAGIAAADACVANAAG
ncbi:hypothetical protein [Hyphomonas sp.]|uniref:hypothetical protein n=1 Tax=Hyphomonas sp. TaxID=87 RepID=UPI0025C1432A|nr:hypothetical protein [Hyphomonas sp.]